MYTFCPDCYRQYRVRADQLSAAQGLVICGYCGRQFNALERLHDKPQKPPLQIPEVVMPPPLVNVFPAHEPVIREKVSGNTDGGGGAAHTRVIKEPQFDLSEALLDKEQVIRPRKRGSFWPAGALLMILLLAGQLAWFNRDDVLAAYPRLMPWAAKLCAHYQCNLYRHADPAAIRILDRDVRVHPRYAQTLLVNATMANQSDRTLPFPKIQFALFDTNGQMLGYREFTVTEYLDQSIDVKKGMAPGQPVHFVLEVTGATKDAVSFEFRFL